MESKTLLVITVESDHWDYDTVKSFELYEVNDSDIQLPLTDEYVKNIRKTRFKRKTLHKYISDKYIRYENMKNYVFNVSTNRIIFYHIEESYLD
jgi:hypothetical protein